MQDLLKLGLILFLLPALQAFASDCGDSPRIIGPFGAENRKPVAVESAKDIRLQLKGAALVRQVLNTHLSPAGEQIIAYDFDPDDSDPKPVVAFAVGGKVVQSLAARDLYDRSGGFERFQVACPFQLLSTRGAVALAFTSAFDGSGSIFSIVSWKANKYALVLTAHGVQGRLWIERGKLSLWTSTGRGECVWCDQHYTVRHYVWVKGRYRSDGRTDLKPPFDPGTISGHPPELISDLSRPNQQDD